MVRSSVNEGGPPIGGPHVYMCVLEREMGFEPTALCLGSTLTDPGYGRTAATEMSPNCDRQGHFENFGTRSAPHVSGREVAVEWR